MRQMETQHGAERPRALQQGFVMIETVVAIAILSTAVFAGITAISTSTKISEEVKEDATAEWVPSSQVDIVRASAFVSAPGVYPEAAAPVGYAVSNSVAAYPGGDSNIQQVTITVLKSGTSVFSTSLIKVNR